MPETHHGITFDTVLNAVTDLGADDSGQFSVDAKIRDSMADDTLIEFPPGEYLWTDEHDYFGLDSTGWRSTTGDPSDVSFVFPQGFDSTLSIRDSSVNVLVEGIEFKQTADRDTGVGLVIRVTDNAQLHNLTFSGFSPSYEPSNQLYTTIETESGVGTIDGVHIDGGGVEDTYSNRMIGIYGGTPHVGELFIRNCDIRELGSSGIRYTSGAGAVKIEDCYFENIDNAGVRTQGSDHPSKETWVKRCEFVNDKTLVEHLPDGEAYENNDMVRIDDEGYGRKGLLVENCTFIHNSDPPDGFLRGCVARVGYADHGAFTVRDCTMQIDDDGPEVIDAVYASDTVDNTVTVDNINVTGSVSNTASGHLIHIGDSPGSEVTDSCINVGSANLNGVMLEGSDNSTVSASAITVGGEQVVTNNSSGVTVTDLSSGDDCTSPDTTTINSAIAPTRDGNISTVNGLVATTSQLTSTGNTVDSFEDGNINEYGGDTSAFTVETDSSWATDGDNVLTSDTTSGSFQEIRSTSGLDTYPDDDVDIYRVSVFPGDTTECDAFVCYRVSDADNMWRIKLNPGADKITLQRREAGTTDRDYGVTYDTDLEPGNRFTVEFDPTSAGGGEFVARVYDGGPTARVMAELESDTLNNGETGVGFAWDDVGGDSAKPRWDDARLA